MNNLRKRLVKAEKSFPLKNMNIKIMEKINKMTPEERDKRIDELGAKLNETQRLIDKNEFVCSNERKEKIAELKKKLDEYKKML